MKVIMEPEFAKRGDLAKLVQAATPLVERLLTKAAGRLTANWGLRCDEHGEPRVHLTISDPLAGDGQAAADFPVNELESPEDAREHLYRLWRDLMDESFDRRLEFLKANVPTE